jgi:GntR family transcriptional regulator, transcriptional repressor for pyruvate dehydrogenase complex
MANPHAGDTDRASVVELVEARILLEPPIAAAAAERHTDADLAALDAATVNALRPQRADERPALHFHTALAAASGNRLLRETVEALLHVREADQVQIRHLYNDRDRDHAEHLAILEAVRARDAAAAADLTRAHLVSIRDALAEPS